MSRACFKTNLQFWSSVFALGTRNGIILFLYSHYSLLLLLSILCCVYRIHDTVLYYKVPYGTLPLN